MSVGDRIVELLDQMEAEQDALDAAEAAEQRSFLKRRSFAGRVRCAPAVLAAHYRIGGNLRLAIRFTWTLVKG